MRAFKSTLEDIEEKRSIHSFHSLHSLRHSKSQCSRPLCEEMSSPPGTTGGRRQNGSYVNMALSVTGPGRSRSRSLETISSSPSTGITTSGGGGGSSLGQTATSTVLPYSATATTSIVGGMTVPTVIIQGASPSPSRTFSDPELNETSI